MRNVQCCPRFHRKSDAFNFALEKLRSADADEYFTVLASSGKEVSKTMRVIFLAHCLRVYRNLMLRSGSQRVYTTTC